MHRKYSHVFTHKHTKTHTNKSYQNPGDFHPDVLLSNQDLDLTFK